MIKVSVIIPMFRVAAFIRKCASSLLEQTLKEVEFIFVDDASPDDSAEIAQIVAAQYPDRNVKFLRHDINKGLPAARNTGLAHACGEYVFHCDGDDWVDPVMLEKLYITATKVNADIAWCDFYISFNTNERYMKTRPYTSPDELLRKGFLAGDMKYNVWNKLVRRSLYVENDILFPDGHSMGEDMTMIRLASCAKSVAYVPEALYHYVKTNSFAFTRAMSDSNLVDIRFNTDETVRFLTERIGSSIDRDIALFKLNVKLPFLITGDKRQYEIWRNWYPEANDYIFSNTELPFRTKLLQWFAAHGLWGIVRAYYILIYKMVYGIIYR